MSVVTPPVFSAKKKQREGYTHIRKYVRSESWRLFSVVAQLNGLNLDVELNHAIDFWVMKMHKNDFVCTKCKNKLDKSNYVIIVDNDNFHFRCMSCVKV